MKRSELLFLLAILTALGHGARTYMQRSSLDRASEELAATSDGSRARAERKLSGEPTDPEFLAELKRVKADFAALQEACLDSSGRLKAGRRATSFPVNSRYLGAIDCQPAFGANASQASWLKGFLGSGFTGYRDYVKWAAYSGVPSRMPAKPATPGELRLALSEMLRQVRPEWLGDDVSQDPRRGGACGNLRAEEGWDLLAPDFAAEASGAPTRKGSVTVEVVKRIEDILSSDSSCAAKKSQITRLFSRIVAAQLDDWTWLAWMSRHMGRVIREPDLRRLIAASTELNSFTSADHDRWQTGSFVPAANRDAFTESAFILKLALTRIHLDLLSSASAVGRHGGYAKFRFLSDAAQKSIVKQAVEKIDSALRNGEFRASLVSAMRQECDRSLARLFGDANAIAAGSGFDAFAALRGPVEGEDLPRMHLYSSMHLYPNSRAEGKYAPLFVPAGGKYVGPGADTKNSSHAFSYARLGNFSNVTLNVVHLGNPEPPNSRSERNAAGSIRVGTLAGPGGDSGTSYDHSHLMIWQGRTRLSFFDAFCK